MGDSTWADMENISNISIDRKRRIRSALMVICAVTLFVAGLLLLFAPAHARRDHSRCEPEHFLNGVHGWIMSAQSHEPESPAGG